MNIRAFVSLLLTLLLSIGSLSAQKLPKPLSCGTSPANDRQQIFLHQRSAERRASLLAAGTRSLDVGGKQVDLQRTTAKVEGDILVMRGDGGVIATSNVFPGGLVGRSIQFQPTDAGATAYQVRLADDAFREDAITGPAINITSTAEGNPIQDDDSRQFELPFAFPFYGVQQTRLFVNSNGHITFGDEDTFAETGTYTGFLSGPPKIAGATLDLNPATIGPTGGIFVFLQPTEVIVSYVRIPRFGSSPLLEQNLVEFQLRITPNGEVRILHRRSPFGQFVMGITPGRNRDTGRLIQFLNPPNEPVGTSVAEIFSSSAQASLDVFRATQTFLESQPDDYDYIVYYNDANISAGLGAVAFAITVQSQVEGIGEEILDRRSFFGNPQRLQAIINMGPLSQYPDGPLDTVPVLGSTENSPLSVLAHEAGHRFLAFPRLREGSVNTFNLLGRQLAHWSFRFNSQGSFMEGSDLSAPPTGENGNTFTTGAPSLRFSELDRYLMGLIAPNQVGLEQSLFYVDGLGATARAPQRDVQIAGNRRGFSMDDIIAANGLRRPDHTIAQRRFRFAFVLVTQDETRVQPALEKLNRVRQEFVNFFHDRSASLAFADTNLRPALELDAFPARGVLAGSEGVLRVTRRGSDGAVSIALSGAGGLLNLPATATLAAGANSVDVPFMALQPGVARVLASVEDGSFLPSEAAIAVASLGGLTLQLTSPPRVQALPDSEALRPIELRVTDARGLPYQGVPVTLEPTTGGSVTPAMATTDAEGRVSFRWTVGSAAVNLAKAFIEGERERTELTVTALPDLLPDVRGATNGASFAAGLSPGSLASLFGVSLAAGEQRLAGFTPLPTELQGVRVSVNGVAAPLVFISDQQVNFYVPAGLSGNTAQVVVRTPDGESNSFETPLFLHQPGVFFDAGTNLGAILRNNFADKTNVTPATPDDFVQIFATGLGPVVPAGRGVFRTASEVTVRMGDRVLATEAVPFAGLAPGFTGLYQVNARVPADLAPGTYSVRLTVGGQDSNEVNMIVGPRPN
jgi:uncharacterized protein (TIGR03437 family)